MERGNNTPRQVPFCLPHYQKGKKTISQYALLCSGYKLNDLIRVIKCTACTIPHSNKSGRNILLAAPSHTYDTSSPCSMARLVPPQK